MLYIVKGALFNPIAPFTFAPMTLIQIVENIYPISSPALDRLLAITETVAYSKGHHLVRSNRVEHFIYFVQNGLVRAYTINEFQDVTFWVGQEGAEVIPMRSYVEQLPTYEEIELLEDSTLYRIPIQPLQILFETDIELANWGRKMIEKEFIRVETRLISLQFKTATERYIDLLADQPNLLQRVPLGIIASYLGITQVSLSRIRAALRSTF